MTANTAPNNTGQESTLKRRLTSAEVAMIALSGALGTGLFLGSGATIAQAGPATIISFTLAGLVALSVVFALAEMTSAHPVPGGHGAIAASYLGPLGGYITRWNFAVTFLFAVGAEVFATAIYINWWLPAVPIWLGTILCGALIVVLNLATVHLYGTTEYWFSMIKVIAISVFILLGIYLIFFDLPEHPAPFFSNLTNHGGFVPGGISGILMGTVLAVFSFGGIENVSVASAESQTPERDIPRAAHTMIWRLLIFYFLAILVIVTLQPWTVTAKGDGSIDQSPFVLAMSATGVNGAAHIMNAVLIVAALSAANGCLYTSSRMIYSLSLAQMAPRVASKVAANGAPRWAVLFATFGMMVAVVLAIFWPEQGFGTLAAIATVGILVTWVMVMLTHLAFRRRRTALSLPAPPARLFGAPVVSVLVIVASLAIFCGYAWIKPAAIYAGIPYVLFLVVSFLVLNKLRALPTPPDLAALEVQARKEGKTMTQMADEVAVHMSNQRLQD